ncbi:MAG: preprotein translocase subunit YajC [Holophagaceae bacterium]|jgi:preprotein translocase subunit YajC
MLAFQMAANSASTQPAWASLILPLGMVILFYLFLIRPQSVARKEMEARLSKLKAGDEVVLSSGLFATIDRLDTTSDNIIYLKLGGSVVKARRQSVVAFANEAEKKD